MKYCVILVRKINCSSIHWTNMECRAGGFMHSGTVLWWTDSHGLSPIFNIMQMCDWVLWAWLWHVSMSTVTVEWFRVTDNHSSNWGGLCSLHNQRPVDWHWPTKQSLLTWFWQIRPPEKKLQSIIGFFSNMIIIWRKTIPKSLSG